jgi:hypothetical protein
MDMLKPRGFWFLVVAVGLFAAAALAMRQRPVRLPANADELSAIAAARRYIGQRPDYRFARERTAGIKEGWVSYEVTFPPACSLTGDAGPIITVGKGSYGVLAATATHSICVPGDEGWLMRAKAVGEAPPAA